jgi:glycosyltransferase involved in cell wall biosynthesis
MRVDLESGNIRIAYGSIPKDGGTFTFYRRLREGLPAHHIEMFCISTGRQECSLWNADYADDGCVRLLADCDDRKLQAQAFVEWCVKNGIHIVIPMNSVAIHCALPYLPSGVHVVSRVADGVDLGYRIATDGLTRLSKIIATTPRHKTDLVQKYAIDEKLITMIPHGIDPAPYDLVVSERKYHAPRIRLGFLGRLEHNQKGVLYLPKIVKSLAKARIDYVLRIAGTGIDERRLRKMLRQEIAEGKVEMVGRIRSQSVPDFLGSVDVFLFPSRFEGFGFVLLEALMAGCVPIVSEIHDLTDFIVIAGRTGCVCPIGDTKAFTHSVIRLANDRELLKQMSGEASSDARQRFNQERMVDDYVLLLNSLGTPPDSGVADWADFQLPSVFRNSWHRYIPRPIKNFLRSFLYRYSS